MSRQGYPYFLKASNKLAPNSMDIKSDKVLLIILFSPIQLCQNTSYSPQPGYSEVLSNSSS